jgi:hypothetical protein
MPVEPVVLRLRAGLALRNDEFQAGRFFRGMKIAAGP